MIQVRFKFHQGNPSGGQWQWLSDTKLFDDDIKADELQAKIKEFTSDDKAGYRKQITYKISRL